MKKTLKSLAVIVLLTLTALNFSTCGELQEDPLLELGELVFGEYANAPADPQPFDAVTAVELVSRIKIGWNLGNTLDSFGGGDTVAGMETAWINPKNQTTLENVTALKNGGFNTIRIPVTWSRAVDTKYNIRRDWMERVIEIVNYAVQNDMYIILNTHHDEGIFKFEAKNAARSKQIFEKIWMQIADAFKNYDEKLIFEPLNEPRTRGSADEWNGGTLGERKKLNEHYQVFVDAVRASGGNNDKRFFLIAPYGASGESAAMNGLNLPQDSAENKLIVSLHSYAPYNFALNTNKAYNKWNESSDKSAVNAPIDRYYNKFVSNGIPVIIGEFGAMNKDNETDRAGWAEYYVGYARSKGMPCVWWDNGVTSGGGELFGLLNRADNSFVYPDLLAGLMKGAGLEN